MSSKEFAEDEDEKPARKNIEFADINISSPFKSPIKPVAKNKEFQTQKSSLQNISLEPVEPTSSLYEETYYITGIKENYLVLLSDSMQVLELPIGIIKGDVKIGDPVRMKLELDKMRVETDRKKQTNLQKDLQDQFSQQ